MVTPSFLYLIALWFHILSRYPTMDNFQHLISQHLYLPAEYCKNKSNSAECVIRDLWFTHSCALHTILQLYYMYLMIKTSHLPQKLFETCIFSTSKFFLSVSFSVIHLILFHTEKSRHLLDSFSFFFCLQCTSLYSCLYLLLIVSRWRCVSPALRLILL